jgi:hypothetical protein
VLPAFASASNSELVAIVSGDAVKRRKLGRKYGLESLCSYEEYDPAQSVATQLTLSCLTICIAITRCRRPPPGCMYSAKSRSGFRCGVQCNRHRKAIPRRGRNDLCVHEVSRGEVRHWICSDGRGHGCSQRADKQMADPATRDSPASAGQATNGRPQTPSGETA